MVIPPMCVFEDQFCHGLGLDQSVTKLIFQNEEYFIPPGAPGEVLPGDLFWKPARPLRDLFVQAPPIRYAFVQAPLPYYSFRQQHGRSEFFPCQHSRFGLLPCKHCRRKLVPNLFWNPSVLPATPAVRSAGHSCSPLGWPLLILLHPTPPQVNGWFTTRTGAVPLGLRSGRVRCGAV